MSGSKVYAYSKCNNQKNYHQENEFSEPTSTTTWKFHNHLERKASVFTEWILRTPRNFRTIIKSWPQIGKKPVRYRLQFDSSTESSQ